MKNEITIVIADDHPVFRQGLRQIIESDLALKVVAEAEDGQSALDRIKETKPEIAILDIDMPRGDGFEVTRALQEKRLPTKVIFLTMHSDERFLNAALDAGVHGYVLKDSAVAEIIQSVKMVSAGHNYISPRLSAYLINRGRRAAKLTSEKPAIASLTPGERRILKLVANFRTNKEIADQLCLSVRTIEHHRANIAEKLELNGSHALVKFAVKHESDL